MSKINTIGAEEEEAVLRVIRSGHLSGYVASNMNGGYEVSALQDQWENFFGVKYSVPCNSATSGLLAACMAAGVGPFDEVIVPYYTMSATACAPAILGATIVMADIDEHFCLDPNEVSRLINENTKAVIATNMFGHPAQLKKLRMICDGAGIILIEDNAQAIMAKEDGVYTGTIGHIGVFSLNVHKHIQTGEGGICITSDVNLYVELNNAINHGECRNSKSPGLNLRMTEITAAIARAQLKKLPEIMQQRRDKAKAIIEALDPSPFFHPNSVRYGCEHSYYALPLLVRTEDFTPGSVARVIADILPELGIGYDGNLLMKEVSNKWFDQERLSQLLAAPSYSRIHSMLMIEICSHDITEDQIGNLRRMY